MLLGPLSITYGVIVGLVTFGADDFLDFIDAYFIEFAMMLFERTYLGNLSASFFTYFEEEIPRKLNNLRKWLTEDVETQGDKMDTDSGGVDINFSDNNSFQRDNEDDSLVMVDQDVLFDRDGLVSSHSSEALADKFKELKKAEIEDDDQNVSMTLKSYGKEVNDSSDEVISISEEEEEEEPESAIEDGLVEVQVEDILGEF